MSQVGPPKQAAQDALKALRKPASYGALKAFPAKTKLAKSMLDADAGAGPLLRSGLMNVLRYVYASIGSAGR